MHQQSEVFVLLTIDQFDRPRFIEYHQFLSRIIQIHSFNHLENNLMDRRAINFIVETPLDAAGASHLCAEGRIDPRTDTRESREQAVQYCTAVDEILDHLCSFIHQRSDSNNRNHCHDRLTDIFWRMMHMAESLGLSTFP